MVLTFALCATFVFAQTATPRTKGEVKKAATTVSQEQHNYGSSIFTKDDPVLFTCDFSVANSNYSTGTIVGGLEGHGQNYDYAQWRRWPNVDSTTFVLAGNTYPRLLQTYFGGWETFYPYLVNYADTAVSSAENGFMMMSMYDQSATNSGNFNAYILFDSIDVSTANVIDVTMFQYYRKYYDYCYIDYNVNGSGNNSTWNEMEINIRGIDVEVNGALWGMYTNTLPTAAAGSPNLGVRIRYKSLNSNTHDAYGYFWMLDDVKLTAGGPYRIKKYAPEEYVEGNYSIIPQGLKINPAWYTQIKNIGYMAQNNINAKLYHLNATQDVATEIDAYNNGSLSIDNAKEVIVDRQGWIFADSMDYRGWYGFGQYSHGSGVDLPTNTLGDNYIYATVSSDSTTIYYDTFFYRVNSAFDGNKYRWGHDNGVLTYMPDNYWLYGYVLSGGNWYVTEDPNRVHYWQTGYMVNTRYTTDAEVPTDWVIHGVELVASPVTNYYNSGSKISAHLSKDSFDVSSVYMPTIITGANVKTITNNDVNDSTIIGRNSAGWLDLGNYNTIYIPFPEQPALEPNTSYRIGYSMEEDGFFALAHEALGRYRVASPTRPDRYDTIIYFRNDESTAKFANVFPRNQYQNYIYDPSYGGDDGRASTFAYYNETNPMIRMIVGPRQEILRHNISITCDSTDYGEAAYAGQPACGVTITPADGSTATITGSTDAYCTATVIVDGVEVQPWDEDSEEGDQNLKVYIDTNAHTSAYQYSFVGVTADHTIHFIFHEPGENPRPISIDPAAAGVRMNLQPNPATSVVNLSIDGVNGMVNCMLIDMSGRVVYNQNINAENAQVINLSNLAKGAYFVRITNDKFSKVEKLIVR